MSDFIYRIYILTIALSLFNFSATGAGINTCCANLPKDTTKQDARNPNDGIDFSLNPTSLYLDYKTLSWQAFNHKRFKLTFDITSDESYFEINRVIQKYFDTQIANINFSSLEEQIEAIKISLKDNLPNYISGDDYKKFVNLEKQKQFYALWRANLVNAKNEDQINDIITNGTKEMIQNGLGDLSENLLPFLSMLMIEQKKHHYDKNRVISTKPSSKGIVNSIEILSALQSLDDSQVAGVCRDVHDMSLRMLRSMYRVYLDEKYPGNNYNVDDYVFLQAWVTPSSQHITLVVLDPENTRNLYELDWGRIYSKKEQEGVEIGNMTGTTIRIWQFDAEKKVSRAIDLVKSQCGFLFDNEILTEKERIKINGTYTPDYSSRASFQMDFGKRNKLGLSAGNLNAGQLFFLTSFRGFQHKMKITSFFEYNGTVGLQTMLVDDRERKNKTLPWADWYTSTNLFTSGRYLFNLRTTPISIKNHFFANLFFFSQTEFLVTMSKFHCTDKDETDKLFSSGDGNIWTSWGVEFSYQHPSNNFNTELLLNSRNFLIPTDVRLLSPNPFELIKHASIGKSGNGFTLRCKFRKWLYKVTPEIRYEFNQLGAEFLYLNLKLTKSSLLGNKYFLQTGTFQQLKGLEYYWYSKSRVWINIGLYFIKRKTSISIFTETIKEKFLSFGISFSKNF